MAELVDALVSGTSVRKDVQVRVLFQAQPSLKLQLAESKPTPACSQPTPNHAQVVELVDTPA